MSQEQGEDDARTGGLPVELMLLTFSFLPLRDLAVAAQVCRRWNQFLNFEEMNKFLRKRKGLPDLKQSRDLILYFLRKGQYKKLPEIFISFVMQLRQSLKGARVFVIEQERFANKENERCNLTLLRDTYLNACNDLLQRFFLIDQQTQVLSDESIGLLTKAVSIEGAKVDSVDDSATPLLALLVANSYKLAEFCHKCSADIQAKFDAKIRSVRLTHENFMSPEELRIVGTIVQREMNEIREYFQESPQEVSTQQAGSYGGSFMGGSFNR